jgi:histidinol phosphatase-like enzyme
MHAPGAGCDCRKPKPGLVIRAAREHGLDLGRSYFVGDTGCDIECGRAAGLQTVLVETGLPEQRPDPAVVRPDYVARDLVQAVTWILRCRSPHHILTSSHHHPIRSSGHQVISR